MDALLVLLGGLLASVSGVFGYKVQASYARKTRFEELVAEKRFVIIPEIYGKLKKLGGMMIQSTPRATKDEIFKDEEWFWTNRLYFPGNVPQYWAELRTKLSQLALATEHMPRDVDRSTRLENEIDALLKNALRELIEEMKVNPITDELKPLV